MSDFHLSIVTPEGTVFEDDVESVVAPGVEGSFGVLARHAPIISALHRGVLQVRRAGQGMFFAVGESFLEVGESGVLVLADVALLAGSLDDAREESLRMEEQHRRNTAAAASDTQWGAKRHPSAVVEVVDED
jgi:F-type H+-transporting ATPase subunit epsilon